MYDTTIDTLTIMVLLTTLTAGLAYLHAWARDLSGYVATVGRVLTRGTVGPCVRTRAELRIWSHYRRTACPAMVLERRSALARLQARGLRAAPVRAPQDAIATIRDTVVHVRALQSAARVAAEETATTIVSAPPADAIHVASRLASLTPTLPGVGAPLAVSRRDTVTPEPTEVNAIGQDADPMPLPAIASNPAYRAWRSRKAAKASAAKRAARRAQPTPTAPETHDAAPVKAWPVVGRAGRTMAYC